MMRRRRGVLLQMVGLMFRSVCCWRQPRWQVLRQERTRWRICAVWWYLRCRRQPVRSDSLASAVCTEVSRQGASPMRSGHCLLVHAPRFRDSIHLHCCYHLHLAMDLLSAFFRCMNHPMAIPDATYPAKVVVLLHAIADGSAQVRSVRRTHS